MNDALVLCLVAAVASVVGAAAATLALSFFQRGEQRRWDGRIGPIESGLEDLREEWLRWQRRRNKRERDASGATESGDQQMTLGDGRKERLDALKARLRGNRGIS